ncbi:MAG: hypothetical protein QXW30_04040 [Saccharolobus sp.]
MSNMYIVDKSLAISGITLLGLSMVMLIIAIVSPSMLAWLAPEPRFYIPVLGFVISSFLLSCCLSKKE